MTSHPTIDDRHQASSFEDDSEHEEYDENKQIDFVRLPKVLPRITVDEVKQRFSCLAQKDDNNESIVCVSSFLNEELAKNLDEETLSPDCNDITKVRQRASVKRRKHRQPNHNKIDGNRKLKEGEIDSEDSIHILRNSTAEKELENCSRKSSFEMQFYEIDSILDILCQHFLSLQNDLENVRKLTSFDIENGKEGKSEQQQNTDLSQPSATKTWKESITSQLSLVYRQLNKLKRMLTSTRTRKKSNGKNNCVEGSPLSSPNSDRSSTDTIGNKNVARVLSSRLAMMHLLHFECTLAQYLFAFEREKSDNHNLSSLLSCDENSSLYARFEEVCRIYYSLLNNLTYEPFFVKIATTVHRRTMCNGPIVLRALFQIATEREQQSILQRKKKVKHLQNDWDNSLSPKKVGENNDNNFVIDFGDEYDEENDEQIISVSQSEDFDSNNLKESEQQQPQNPQFDIRLVDDETEQVTSRFKTSSLWQSLTENSVANNRTIVTIFNYIENSISAKMDTRSTSTATIDADFSAEIPVGYSNCNLVTVCHDVMQYFCSSEINRKLIIEPKYAVKSLIRQHSIETLALLCISKDGLQEAIKLGSSLVRTILDLLSRACHVHGKLVFRKGFLHSPSSTTLDSPLSSAPSRYIKNRNDKNVTTARHKQYLATLCDIYGLLSIVISLTEFKIGRDFLLFHEVPFGLYEKFLRPLIETLNGTEREDPRHLIEAADSLNKLAENDLLRKIEDRAEAYRLMRVFSTSHQKMQRYLDRIIGLASVSIQRLLDPMVMPLDDVQNPFVFELPQSNENENQILNEIKDTIPVKMVSQSQSTPPPTVKTNSLITNINSSDNNKDNCNENADDEHYAAIIDDEDPEDEEEEEDDDDEDDNSDDEDSLANLEQQLDQQSHISSTKSDDCQQQKTENLSALQNSLNNRPQMPQIPERVISDDNNNVSSDKKELGEYLKFFPEMNFFLTQSTRNLFSFTASSETIYFSENITSDNTLSNSLSVSPSPNASSYPKPSGDFRKIFDCACDAQNLIHRRKRQQELLQQQHLLEQLNETSKADIQISSDLPHFEWARVYEKESRKTKHVIPQSEILPHPELNFVNHAPCSMQPMTYPFLERLICRKNFHYIKLLDHIGERFDSNRATYHVVYDIEQPSLDGGTHLQFNSRFECGNLRKVLRKEINMQHEDAEDEYLLLLNSDVNTAIHTQWFYFSVAGPAVADRRRYRFKIINMQKKSILYNSGQQPAVYSVREFEKTGREWHRIGTHKEHDTDNRVLVAYYRNHYARSRSISGLYADKPYYTLEFTFSFAHDNDICYFAYNLPFSYTFLRTNIVYWKHLVEHHNKRFADQKNKIYFETDTLCRTLSGNELPLLTITSAAANYLLDSHTKSETDCAERPTSDTAAPHYVFLTARVHPSESNSSWVLKGLIDFLLTPSNTPTNESLRRRLISTYVFKIVPMLNPDGVINGCTRTDLQTDDLNRQWQRPNRLLHPTIYHSRMLLKCLSQYSAGRNPIAFIDLHGHSRRKNIFSYSCSPALSWKKIDRRQYQRSINLRHFCSACPPTSANATSNCELRAQMYHLKQRNLLTDDASGAQQQLRDYRYYLLPPFVTLPVLLHLQQAPSFSLNNCSFVVQKDREHTARVVSWREFNIPLCYTIECSASGCDTGPYAGQHLTATHLEEMGQNLACSFAHLDFACCSGRHVPLIVLPKTDVASHRVMNGSNATIQQSISPQSIESPIHHPGNDDYLQNLLMKCTKPYKRRPSGDAKRNAMLKLIQLYPDLSMLSTTPISSPSPSSLSLSSDNTTPTDGFSAPPTSAQIDAEPEPDVTNNSTGEKRNSNYGSGNNHN